MKTVQSLARILGRDVGCNDNGHFSQDFYWCSDDEGFHCTCAICGSVWTELQKGRKDAKPRIGQAKPLNYKWVIPNPFLQPEQVRESKTGKTFFDKGNRIAANGEVFKA